MQLDSQERIHVIDVSSMTLVDIVDLTKAQLAMSEKFSQALVNAGRRDRTLPSLKAYDNAVADINGQVYLLGMTSVTLVNIMKWHERIAFLTGQNKFVEAIELTMTFYNEKALAAVGLAKDPVRRKEVCKDKLHDLIQAYADITFASFRECDSEEETLEECGGVARVCIDACISLGSREFLFSSIYSVFAAVPLARAAFLKRLVPLIRTDVLRSLNPVVMKDLVEYFQSKGQLQVVEECVLHLDVRNLDIHQVVVMCWRHQLYDAMIYVYNRGLNDFTTPLVELVQLLASVLRSQLKNEEGNEIKGSVAARLPQEQQDLGYKLLLYTSFCLSGKAFPTGDIPAAYVERVRWQVYRCMVSREGKSMTYPVTRTLLQFDTREFLNVLSIEFDADEGGEGGEGAAGQQLPRRQQVVDILLEIMIAEPQRQGLIVFAPNQIGQLFTFLARQMARHPEISVGRDTFDTVLNYLSNSEGSEDITQHEEREQALLELLNVGTMPFDPDRLLALSERAQFYRVCQLVHSKRGDHHKIIGCYLKDSSRKTEVFAYVHHVLGNSQVPREEIKRVRDVVISEIPELVRTDAILTAQLLLASFRDVLDTLVNRLVKAETLQYQLLFGIFRVFGVRGDADDDDDGEPEVPLSPKMHELYIELMCKLEPNKVYQYLRDNNDYRIEPCLAIVTKHRVTDAVAWLMERSGRVQEAFRLILDTVLSQLKLLNKCFVEWETSVAAVASSAAENGVPDAGLRDRRGDALKRLRAILAVAISMCLRVSDDLDEPGRRGIWFPLLDSLIDSQRWMKTKLTTSFGEYSVVVRELTRHVVNSMMGFVALPAILTKIMANGSSIRSFGEVKDLIIGMLETYNYEKTLLSTVNRIVDNDLYWLIRGRMDTVRKGLRHRGGIGPEQQNADTNVYLCQSDQGQTEIDRIDGRGPIGNKQRNATFSFRELMEAQDSTGAGGNDGDGGGFNYFQYVYSLIPANK